MELVRESLQWKIRDRELTLGPRTLLAGVVHVNVTSQDGDKGWVDDVLKQADKMQQAGSDLLDLQVIGEISRQYMSSILPLSDPDEELRRLVPVLRKMRRNIDVPICVTTRFAPTAERVLELGVDVIRDWSGLCFDPDLARVVNNYDAGLVLGHARGGPDSWSGLSPLSDPVAGVVKDLENSMARAREVGVDSSRIVLDPGFEHGKKGAENLLTLAQLDLLAHSKRPILVSMSRKRFLTESVRSSETESRYAEAAATTMALLAGAHILRVDDVEEQGYVSKFVDRLFEVSEPWNQD